MGNPLKKAFRFIAPIVGAIVGGPLGAAVGGALGQTVTGGNRKDILAGGITAGLGAYGGQAAGSLLGGTNLAKAAGIGSFVTASGSSIGAGLGTYLMEKEKQDMYDKAKNAAMNSIAFAPSFEDIRADAVNAARNVFERERIADMILTHRLPKSRRGRDITIYNRHKFRPLKEIVKERSMLRTNPQAVTLIETD